MHPHLDHYHHYIISCWPHHHPLIITTISCSYHHDVRRPPQYRGPSNFCTRRRSSEEAQGRGKKPVGQYLRLPSMSDLC